MPQQENAPTPYGEHRMPSWFDRILNTTTKERTFLWLDEEKGGRPRKALKTALFAVVQSDLAKPVLNYLVDATKTMGFGFAGPAQVYADLVNKASDAIFGTPGSTKLQVGLDRTFGADDLTSGYLFVSDAPSGTFDRAKLTFKDDNRIHYDGGLGDFAYTSLTR